MRPYIRSLYYYYSPNFEYKSYDNVICLKTAFLYKLNKASLPLFAILFFIPLAIIPAYAATENLFVSAENSLFDNHFEGSMVIEVVVNDPDLNDLDDAIGEPDVTINGADLRMVQATDGKWYAYFANLNKAKTADQIVLDVAGAAGESLDFGVFL